MIILAEKSAGQNSAYRHRKYEGRFRKRRRPSLFLLQVIEFIDSLNCFADRCRPCRIADSNRERCSAVDFLVNVRTVEEKPEGFTK